MQSLMSHLPRIIKKGLLPAWKCLSFCPVDNPRF